MKIKEENFIIRSGSANVMKIITDDNVYIKKTLYRKPQEKYDREIKALDKLGKYNHYPKVVEKEPKKFTFYMTYCGKKINKRNIPKNWLEQVNEIRKELNDSEIVNGDLNENHILVLDGIIYIIDFGNIRLKSDNYFKTNDYEKYEKFQHGKLLIICKCALNNESSWNKL